ncbi:LOW QUALITY PROTEIN: hypothetical protein Cgig2_032137 [Carnegiea gigantea]|uniref:Uncharacterized protein n=1 Tax=Carnegiea gigantea TaxID=171969 RepID=A0A9Q1K2L2_9CARY|nr:LOW QUALITY PROTEIN: hypothetical protein Cgig2_032137 [Carnegiea gigantea]
MRDTIMRQVSEQLQRAMEAANSTSPLPHFEYAPTIACKPFYRPVRVPSPHHIHTDRDHEASQSNQHCQPRTGSHDRLAAVTTWPSSRLDQGQSAKSTTASADKGQIDHFLKKGTQFLSGEQEPTQPQPLDEECSTEVVATIAGGYAKGMTWSAWKAQLRSTQQVLTVEQGVRLTATTMVFGGRNAPRFTSPHSDLLVVEMKYNCSDDLDRYGELRGHHHMRLPEETNIPRKGHCPLGASHFSLWGVGGEPTGMIRLSLCFGDRLKARNLEVDFLVVDFLPSTE